MTQHTENLVHVPCAFENHCVFIHSAIVGSVIYIRYLRKLQFFAMPSNDRLYILLHM